MSTDITTADLEAYLDEGLSPEEMARIESAVRDNRALLAQLAAINGRRDAGVHTLGEIWRRHRIGCPTRQELGSYLLGMLAAEPAQQIRTHLETVSCRLCLANLNDLLEQQKQTGQVASGRRQRYFQSSAPLLRKS